MAIPELACAVPFYGRQPPIADVDKIHAPLLLHYAELDKPITCLLYTSTPTHSSALSQLKN